RRLRDLHLGRSLGAARAGRDGRAEGVHEALVGAHVRGWHHRLAVRERLLKLQTIRVAVVPVVRAGAEEVAARVDSPARGGPLHPHAAVARQGLLRVEAAEEEGAGLALPLVN